MEVVSGKILGVSDSTLYFWSNIKTISGPIFILDILIVATLFYWVFIFLRETRAMRILYGLIFLVIVMLIGQLFNLVLLNWILKYLMTMLVIAIPVVFQPELRAALERLGRTNIINDLTFSKESYLPTIEAIVSATHVLSKNRTGALIVIQRQTGLREYIENGVEVNGHITKDLLLSIFFPKSPLHDGAVIISNEMILSARSTLPVSETVLSSEYGTRHKAGIGITENSDAISIIVSEETGGISIAVTGKLERKVTEERLRNKLASLLKKQK